MTGPAGQMRASDADRDDAAAALADAVGTGRLTLEDHSARLDRLYAAVTQDQVAAVTSDLPALPARRTALFRTLDAHRCVVIGGQVHRTGRFRIGRFCTLVAIGGRLDLDLRGAQLSQQDVSITVWGAAARVAIIVPTGWRLSDDVLVLGTRRAIPANERDAHAPMLRVRGTCVGGSFHLTQS